MLLLTSELIAVFDDNEKAKAAFLEDAKMNVTLKDLEALWLVLTSLGHVNTEGISYRLYQRTLGVSK